ncbi:RHS repeat-associated core domain-containing protein [Thorsellia anophelis]|uniref:RHS repeat-associated core domain-containing protein n=1 Tax=Thorsellia anophelis DSM 18579 TaxID=1123402 RepID=A0A1I0FPE2_9GAMM|nr:RHS repeat-associated core domain-containing protein [Thorsellia anophelis]SET59192.1 RHS repeat-associated core domain-containing protein [Thorsellia anophelis DSM 18579]
MSIYHTRIYVGNKYDAQGRLIEKRVAENGFRPRTYFYYWNALNQLVRYITSQGDEWHYQYDAFGRRIRKFQVIHHDHQVETQPRPSPLSQPKSQPKIGCEYYYLGDQLIEEAPIYADGTVAFEHSTHWLYAPNQLTPTARYQQGELNYVITDQIGTPTELLAEDGTGRWRVKHNLWGSILKQYSANDDDFCNLRFPGQYLDNESGLHYNRHRYYDPNTAQYLTPDPIGLAGGFNPYGYVHNPTGWTDSLGLIGEDCCSIKNIDPKTLISRQNNNEMSGSAIKKYAKNMKENGFDVSQSIDVAIVRGKMIIIDGHHRVASAIKAGIDNIPVRINTVSPEMGEQLLIEAAEASVRYY